MADQAATLLEALPELAGRSVLVVGCGDGRYPRLFRSKGARRVVGVDAGQVQIAVAQREEERDPIGISYEVHSLARLPIMGSFDIVTALVDSPDLVDRLAANLGPRGQLVVVSPDTATFEEALRDNGFVDVDHHGNTIVSGRKGT